MPKTRSSVCARHKSRIEFIAKFSAKTTLSIRPIGVGSLGSIATCIHCKFSNRWATGLISGLRYGIRFWDWSMKQGVSDKMTTELGNNTAFVLKSYVPSAAMSGGICRPFCRSLSSVVSLYSARYDNNADNIEAIRAFTQPVVFTLARSDSLHNFSYDSHYPCKLSTT
jgi:hypothetical protein